MPQSSLIWLFPIGSYLSAYFLLVHTYLPISYWLKPSSLFPIGSYQFGCFLLIHTNLAIPYWFIPICIFPIGSYLIAVLLDKFKHKASVNQWKKVKQEEGKTRVQPLRLNKILKEKKNREFKKKQRQRKKNLLTDSLVDIQSCWSMDFRSELSHKYTVWQDEWFLHWMKTQ